MSEQKVVKQQPIASDTSMGLHFVLDATVYSDGAPSLEGDEGDMRLEAICEAYAEDLRARINLGAKMLEAAQNLPDTDNVSEQEQALVLKLEAEVDAAFGLNAHLYGRAVALYAIRDLAAG